MSMLLKALALAGSAFSIDVLAQGPATDGLAASYVRKAIRDQTLDTDPVLKARYGEHVPVLMDGDTELCRYHYDPAKFAAYAAEIR